MSLSSLGRQQLIRRRVLSEVALVSAVFFGSLAVEAQSQNQLQPVQRRKLGSLATVNVRTDPAIDFQFKRSNSSLRALGKALFWDMNVGSDGKQACATCHFNAGADSRAMNQVSPGLKSVDAQGNPNPDHTFQIGSGPNYQLTFNDFPIPTGINDVISSAGVHATNFVDIVSGQAQDLFDTNFLNPDPDGFSIGGINTRKVEPRNTPTTIGAVFNFRNFWDGRAQNECNFLNPFGKRDQDQRNHLFLAARKFSGGKWVNSLVTTKPTVFNSSLCSQALGPPLSKFEMSSDNRAFRNLGKKMLSLQPLSQQKVDPTDHRLGNFASLVGNGLKVSYSSLIQSAFEKTWWNSPVHICVDSLTKAESFIDTSQLNPPSCPVGSIDYSQMEYNFSLFWGLSVQAYEAELTPDRSRVDLFFEAANLTNTTVAAGAGDGASTSFSALLTAPVLLNSVTVKAGTVSGSDDGAGNIVSDAENGDVSGVIDYSTGAITVNFLAPPAVSAPVNVTYQQAPAGILTAQELQGLDVFSNKGKCIACHSGPEFTNASVANVTNEPLERMFFQPSNTVKVYDNGFYNTGVRQTLEDISNGDIDGTAGANPLSMSEVLRQAVCKNPNLIINVPPRPGENILGGPLLCADVINRFGAFKTPSIRNVELTAPYFHNGGARTLGEVVDFYDRGGDFAALNQDSLDPNIVPLGLTQQEKDALVAFMMATTDPRVKFQKAPFDHPSLMVSNGHSTAGGGLIPDASGHGAADNMLLIPAVGSHGSLQPLCTFSENIAGPCP